MQSGIDDRMKLPKLIISGASEELQAQLKPTLVGLSRFVNIEEIEIGEDIETSGMSATSVVDELRLTIPLEGVIDIEAEVARLEKQIGDLNKNIERAEKQLGNAKFVERAPEAVVQQARDRLQSDQQAVKVLEEQLNELKSQA